MDMNVFGIVAEYNPFHNGHYYQIKMARNLGATHIVVVMSPNFVQRGQPAIIDKFYRADIAVNCGADLVIELPTIYSLSSAERFAFGAIFLLNNINVIDYLIFGSECNNVDYLIDIVNIIESNEFKIKLLKNLKDGISFANARHLVIEELLGKDQSFEIKRPNNILAIEYIKWIKRFKSQIKPISLKRIGVGHDAMETSGEFASASYLRNILIDSKSISSWKQFVPDYALEIYDVAYELGFMPAIEELGERAILAKLRASSISQIRAVNDVSEGIENRIYAAIHYANSIKNIFDKIKTKRYAMSRIRRIIYNLFLDIDMFNSKIEPPYVRVLATNRKGIEIINKIKNSNCELFIDSNFNKISKSSSNANILAEIENNATNMYALFCENIGICDYDYKRKFFVVE